MVGGEVPGESVGLALELLNDLGEPFGQAALGQIDLVSLTPRIWQTSLTGRFWRAYKSKSIYCCSDTSCRKISRALIIRNSFHSFSSCSGSWEACRQRA